MVMKNMLVMSSIILVLCSVSSIIAMDDAVKKQLLIQAGVHVDLMDAAKTLPLDKDDENHLCLKELKTAARDFKLEKSLYDKNTPGTVPVKKMIADGERALQGARFLINNFILCNVQDKAEIEQLRQKINTLEKEKKSAEQNGNRIKMTLEKKIKTLNEAKDQSDEDLNFHVKNSEDNEAKIKQLCRMIRSRNIVLLFSWLGIPVLSYVLLKFYGQRIGL